jgi:hypothetical protein
MCTVGNIAGWGRADTTAAIQLLKIESDESLHLMRRRLFPEKGRPILMKAVAGINLLVEGNCRMGLGRRS